MIALDALATAPEAVWQQHAPPAWAIAVALAGVAWLAAPRGVPGRCVGLIALLPLFVVAPDVPAPGAFRITILDVGQGLAVVVATHGHTLLYDTGPRYNEESDAGGRIVAPYLRAAGVARLDAMIVTHQDSDHSGGALSVLATVPVGWLASSLRDDHAILAAARERRGASHRCAVRAALGMGRRALSRAAARPGALRECAAEDERPFLRRSRRIRFRHGAPHRRPRGARRAGARARRPANRCGPTCWSCRITGA